MSIRPIFSRALVLWSFAASFAVGCGGDDQGDAEPSELPDDVIRIIEESQHPLQRSVSQENLRVHLEFLTRSPRSPDSDHLEASRQYCASELERYGYEVERIPVDGTEFVNVIGTLTGVSNPEDHVLLSAHLDGVPDCDAADDNATGVAGVLEAARLLATREHGNTLVVACWDGEERGLAGSMHYAADQRERGTEILVAFVFDMIGFTSSEPNSQQLPVSAEEEPLFSLLYPELYRDFVDRERRGDFIALLHDAPRSITPAGAYAAANAFLRRTPSWELELRTYTMPLTAAITDLLPYTKRSDHAAFWQHGYSAILITDTGDLRNPNYHCERGADSPDTIDLKFMTKVTRATVSAVVHELERRIDVGR